MHGLVRRLGSLVFAITVAAVLLLNAASARAADSFENDDSSAVARQILANGSVATRTLDPVSDQDWLYFDAVAGHRYLVETVEAGDSGVDTVCSLVASDGTTPLAVDDDSGPGMLSRIVWTAPASGRYFIRVWGLNSTAVSYGVKLSPFDAGSITGSIVDPNTGSPRWEYSYLYRKDSTGQWMQVGGGLSASSLSIGNLDPGTYRIKFTSGRPSIYLGESAHSTNGTEIVVESGGNTALGTVPVQETGSLKVLMRDAQSGLPIPAATISLYATDSAGAFAYFDAYSADGAGECLVSALRPEKLVRFRIVSPGYIDGWSGGGTGLTSASEVLIPSATTTIVAVNLSPLPHIKGRITDAITGEPVAGSTVSIFNSNGALTKSVSADDSGSYDSGGLPTGSYTVKSSGSGYFEGWYGGESVSSPSLVTLQSNGNVRADITLKPSAVLSGVIHLQNSSSSSFATLYKQADSGEWISQTTNGGYPGERSYSFSGLQAGTYKVGFHTYGDHARLFNGQAGTIDQAPEIRLVAGQRLAGVDATLSVYRVRGRVTDSQSNLPIESAYVYASNSGGAYTDSAGFYTITGVQAASTLHVSKYDYKSGYWNASSATATSTGTPLDVPGPSTDLTANVALETQPYGSIEGTITDVDGPIDSPYVDIYRWRGSYWGYYRWLQASASGHYRSDRLPTGTYLVRASAGGHNYRYAPSTTSRSSATHLRITSAAEQLTADILLPRYATIAGHVQAADDRSTEGVAVTSQGQQARVDSSGSYRVTGVYPGLATLKFRDPSGTLATRWWSDSGDSAGARQLGVTEDATTTADITLPLAGFVEGTVENTSGAPLPGVSIAVGTWTLGETGWKWRTVESATSDEWGKYSVRGLSSGNYRVRFVSNRSDMPTAFLGGTSNAWNSSEMTVSTAATTSLPPAKLFTAGSLSGTVLDDEGLPVPGVAARAYRFNGNRWKLVGQGWTDSTGRFSVSNLAGGDYRVSVGGGYSGLVFYPETFTNGASNTARADSHHVAWGADTPLGYLVAPRSGTISGRVTDETSGFGVSSTNVDLYRYDSLSEYWEWMPHTTASGYTMSTASGYTFASNSDGTYRLSHLRPGRYRLRFSDPGSAYHAEYYDNSATIAGSKDAVVSPSAATGNIDVALTRTDLSASQASYATGWQPQPTLVQLSALSGLRAQDTLVYSVDGSAPATAYTGPFVVDTDGITALSYQVVSASGESEPLHTDYVLIDTQAPTVSSDARSSYSTSAKIMISAKDSVSSVKLIKYKLDSEPTMTVSGSAATLGPVTGAGGHTLRYEAVDAAGNRASKSAQFVIGSSGTGGGGGGVGGGSSGDIEPPTTTGTLSGAGWSSKDVTVTLSADDGPQGSGVAYTLFQVGTGAETTYTAPFTVEAEGETAVKFRSVDKAEPANFEASKTLAVKIDRTAPGQPNTLSYVQLSNDTITLLWPGANDAVSEVVSYEVFDNESPAGSVSASATSLSLSGLTPGSSHVFSVKAVDAAGNKSLAAPLSVVMPSSASSAFLSPAASRTVTMTLPSETGANLDATVTVTGITKAGKVTVVRATNPPTPAVDALRFLGINYDVSFSGSFTGTVTVTLPYDHRIPDERARNVQLRHYTARGAWEDLVTAVDMKNHTLTASLTSLSPIVAVEPASTNTSATISAPKIVTSAYGTQPTMSAKLMSQDATPLALPGFTLLAQKWVAGAWSTVTTLPVSGASGSCTAKLPVMSVATQMRVVLEGNSLYSAQPASFTVKPRAKLTTPKASTSSTRAYRSFSMKGMLSPAHSGSVQVKCYRLSGSSLKYVKSTTVKATAAGNFSTSFKLPRGTYRFRAYHGSTTTLMEHALSQSSLSSKVVVR